MTTAAATTTSMEQLLAQATADSAAIKQRQQATWASVDFAIIGVTLQIVGESLAEAADIRAGEQVLDIGAGNGNATLAAARRFADVISTDFVPELLEKKDPIRAAVEGLEMESHAVDAELAFYEGSFDAVLSTYGVMFKPDHKQSAKEMLRVTRGAGRIGLANWTPTGFMGQLFKIIDAHVAPPAGQESPTLWGTQPYLHALFGDHAANITVVNKHFNFRYHSATHWLNIFRNFYGPMNKAFAALDAVGQDALEKDIKALLQRFNVAGPSSLVVPAEYLEVVITKRRLSSLSSERELSPPSFW